MMIAWIQWWDNCSSRDWVANWSSDKAYIIMVGLCKTGGKPTSGSLYPSLIHSMMGTLVCKVLIQKSKDFLSLSCIHPGFGILLPQVYAQFPNTCLYQGHKWAGFLYLIYQDYQNPGCLLLGGLHLEGDLCQQQHLLWC